MSSETIESHLQTLSTGVESIKDYLQKMTDFMAWFQEIIAKSGYKGSPDLESREFRKQFESWIENLAANAPSSSSSGIVTFSRETKNSRRVIEMSIPDTENPGRMKTAVFVREGKPAKVVKVGNATSSTDVKAETTDNIPPSSAAPLRSTKKSTMPPRAQTSEELRAIIRAKFKANKIQQKTESQPGPSISHQNSDHPGVDELSPLESQNIHMETASNAQKSNSK